MKKQIFTGLLLSIFATLAGSYIVLDLANGNGFEKNWQIMRDMSDEGIVLSLGAIPNLLLFFVFLRKKQEYRARGVLMGVILVAFAVMYFSFFQAGA